jgi:hypothetical protein
MHVCMYNARITSVHHMVETHSDCSLLACFFQGDALALAGQSAANSVFSTAFFLVSFLPTVMAPLVASAVGAGDLDTGVWERG